MCDTGAQTRHMCRKSNKHKLSKGSQVLLIGFLEAGIKMISCGLQLG